MFGLDFFGFDFFSSFSLFALLAIPVLFGSIVSDSLTWLSEQLKNIFYLLYEKIKNAANFVVDSIKEFLENITSTISNAVIGVLKFLKSTVETIFKFFEYFFDTVYNVWYWFAETITLTENGAVETTGYSMFSNGLQLSMLLNRVSDNSYAIDIDLSVSIFDKNDKSTIPATDRSSIKADGLLVQDSQVYYIGSLRRDNRSDKGGLFSFDFNKSHDMLTIWLRVRELKISLL